MSGININYDIMTDCINNIQGISGEYPTKERPSCEGCGLAISEMESIAMLYESFYQEAEELFSCTASYLMQVVSKFQEEDEQKTAGEQGEE